MAIKADETLDTIGLFCPLPIIHTSRKIKEMRVGQILQVLSDDAGIKVDIPAWCKSTGQQFLGLEEHNGIYRVYVKKVTE